MFVDNLKKSATTRACIFATIHKDLTIGRIVKYFIQSGCMKLWTTEIDKFLDTGDEIL